MSADDAAKVYEIIGTLDVDELANSGPVSQLMSMSKTMGAKPKEIEEALDEEDPKNAFAKLLESAAAEYKTKEDALNAEIDKEKQDIKQQCEGKGVAWMQKRAQVDGFKESEIDAALDGDDKKGDLLKLLLSEKVLKNRVIQRQKQKLVEEEEMSQFASMKPSQLKRKAKELGVSDDDIDNALDQEDGRTPLCRLIIESGKKRKTTSSVPDEISKDGLALLPQAATDISQEVMSVDPPLISTGKEGNLMAAYTNCRTDNVLDVMYIKAGQTTINGTTKGVGLFVCDGMTLYMTPQWGSPSELFVATCQQFTPMQKVRIHNVAGPNNGREWPVCKDLHNAHFRPQNNCSIEKLDNNIVGNFRILFTPFGVLNKFNDWEIVSVKGFVYEANASSKIITLLEGENVVQVRINVDITMPSERDELELIGVCFHAKFMQLTIEDYTHITIKRAARKSSWPSRLRRIGQ